MRKIFLLTAALFITLAVHAEKLPKKVGKARHSVASLLVYSNGVVKDSGSAFFVGDNGDAIVPASLLQGADSAVIIDTKGKVRPVENVVALNDLYGCAKVRIADTKKIVPLEASGEKVTEGACLYLVAYGKKDSGVVEKVKVTAVDSLYSHAYYTIEKPVMGSYSSLPLVNGEGELVAVMQPESASDTISSYAVGASMIGSLNSTSVTYGRGYYPNIGISTALPLDKESALSCMYMQTMIGDSLSYRNAINSFMAMFPSSYEGYMCDAEHQALYCRDMRAAEMSWGRAVELAEKPSEAYFGKAKVLNTIVQGGDTLSYPGVTLESALEELDKAIAADNMPVYIEYKAGVLLAAERYAAAYDCYISLTEGELRNADMFARASQCQGALKNYGKAVELMDSAINMLGEDELLQASPYILTRALLKYSAENYREAVFDYNLYEEVSGKMLNANFYYLRSQAEVKAKMYQQALNDLEKSISIEPLNVVFYIEKGLLCYRLSLFEEGIEVLESAKEFEPEQPDVHYLLGCIYMKAGKKELAAAALRKAVELEHPDAAARLEELETR